MPLSCDCYGGCWGEHSKNWPKLILEADMHALARKLIIEKKLVPYGSYVSADKELRLETLEYYDKVHLALATYQKETNMEMIKYFADCSAREVYAVPESKAKDVPFTWFEITKDIYDPLHEKTDPIECVLALRAMKPYFEEHNKKMRATLDNATLPELLEIADNFAKHEEKKEERTTIAVHAMAPTEDEGREMAEKFKVLMDDTVSVPFNLLIAAFAELKGQKPTKALVEVMKPTAEKHGFGMELMSQGLALYPK